MQNLNLDKLTQIISDTSKTALNDLLFKLKPFTISQKYTHLPQHRIIDWVFNKHQYAKQKILQKKKYLLIQQLNQVQGQLFKIQQRKYYSNSLNTKKKQIYYSNDHGTNRDKIAAVLKIHKNKQPHSTSINKYKSKSMQLQMKRSFKKIQQLKRQRYQQRQRIQQRMERRHKQLGIYNNLSNKSNLINESIYNPSTLPLIPHSKNPENLSTQLIQKSTKNSPSKKYPKSSFFIKLMQEEAVKKKKDYQKSYEKKKIRERQFNYWNNIIKSLKFTSVFITNQDK